MTKIYRTNNLHIFENQKFCHKNQFKIFQSVLPGEYENYESTLKKSELKAKCLSIFEN